MPWSFGDSSIQDIQNSKIYQLARTLLQDSIAPEDVYNGRALESKIRNTFAKVAESNPYSMALFPMQRLPPEIRNIIWEYVDFKTAAGAFTIVTGETLRLAKSLNWPDRREISLHSGSQISLKMISVFGTSYIQAFEHGDITNTITGVVDRLSFVIALGGICAIKLFGTGWDSGWLGKIPVTKPVWHGTIPEIGSSLTCSFNHLYCTRISGLGVITSQILWDQPTVPVSLTLPRTANLHSDQPRPDLISSPQTRYFRYLPLLEGNEYATGLAMYHSGNGIVGLEAHFTRTSRLSGSRNGCPIYFPLGSKERIDFVWRRVQNTSSVQATPSLTIHTTLGRTCSFGSYVLPRLVQDGKYEWIPFDIRGYITGFYFETPTTVLSTWTGPDAGLYLSFARLGGLKEVQLCRLGSRCTGIMIHYFHSPPVVLGQWHTSFLSKHSSIDVRNVSTMHVERSKSGGYYIVSNITFSADENRDGKPDTFSINE
ncbi:hypothetical protein EG329_009453 [Mollisiaceae sp. DMI_Dod_QoI]|nr:hypothetical protein EG329_009453 [Helotiales sp. DMI_Dod_QoI]